MDLKCATFLVIHSKPSTQSLTPQLNCCQPFTYSFISNIYWFPKLQAVRLVCLRTIMNRTDTAPALRGLRFWQGRQTLKQIIIIATESS